MDVFTLPPRLQPGDTLAIVHPAGPVTDRPAFEQGVHFLKKMGLQIKQFRPGGSGLDYLSADDRQRLQELHAAWRDNEVKAIMAARGGYGCLRIISGLDLDFIRAHPKWLIGFSDITVLLNALFQQTGLVSLHGPVVSSLNRLDGKSLERFKEQLGGEFKAWKNLSGLEVLRGGFGQGRLVGGNLTTLTHMIGTPWQPQTSGTVLFLEDTAEPPYKLDRMLTHLTAAGLLENLAGLVLGMFDPGHEDRLETMRFNEQVWKRILELTRKSSYPVWGGLPIGHQRVNYSLPVGMEAVMDSSVAALNFLCR